jgi:hypothetical protein
MLTVEMHARGCVGVDCTRKKKSRFFIHWLNLYMKEGTFDKQGQE